MYIGLRLDPIRCYSDPHLELSTRVEIIRKRRPIPPFFVFWWVGGVIHKNYFLFIPGCILTGLPHSRKLLLSVVSASRRPVCCFYSTCFISVCYVILLLLKGHKLLCNYNQQNKNNVKKGR